MQLVEPSELWGCVSERLSAAEAELPKPPPGANVGHQAARPPLPVSIATLQPLVECYFAICSACSLVAAPQAPPALDTAVSPEDVASGAYTDAASADQGMQAVGAMARGSSTNTSVAGGSSLPGALPESPAGTGAAPQCDPLSYSAGCLLLAAFCLLAEVMACRARNSHACHCGFLSSFLNDAISSSSVFSPVNLVLQHLPCASPLPKLHR